MNTTTYKRLTSNGRNGQMYTNITTYKRLTPNGRDGKIDKDYHLQAFDVKRSQIQGNRRKTMFGPENANYIPWLNANMGRGPMPKLPNFQRPRQN